MHLQAWYHQLHRVYIPTLQKRHACGSCTSRDCGLQGSLNRASRDAWICPLRKTISWRAEGGGGVASAVTC